MKIRALVALPIKTICVVTIALVVVVGARIAVEWRSTSMARTELRSLTLLLTAQDALCAERSPTLTAFGAGPSSREHTAMLAVRALTDASLQVAAADLTPRAAEPAVASALATLRSVGQELAAARARDDSLLQYPDSARTTEEVAAAIAGFTRLPPAMAPALEASARAAISAQPRIMGPVVMARAAADLRDYAGRLTMSFRLALRKRSAFSLAQIVETEEIEGHLNELDRQIGVQRRMIGPGFSELDRALQAMHQHYFGEFRLLVWRLTAEGLGYGHLDIDDRSLLAGYKSSVRSIAYVRQAALAVAESQVEAVLERTRWRLGVLLTFGAAVMGLVARALFQLRRRVIQPLIAMADVVMRLAAGQRDVTIAAGPPGGEIADLAEAIGKLREAAITADAATEQRRQALAQRMDQLQQVCVALQAARLAVDELSAAASSAEGQLHEAMALLAPAGSQPPGSQPPGSQPPADLQSLLADMAETCTARCSLLRHAVAALATTTLAIEAEIAGAQSAAVSGEAAAGEPAVASLQEAADLLQNHAERIGSVIADLNHASLSGMTAALPALRGGISALPPDTLSRLAQRTTDDAAAIGSAFARLRKALVDAQRAVRIVVQNNAGDGREAPRPAAAKAQTSASRAA